MSDYEELCEMMGCTVDDPRSIDKMIEMITQ